MNRTLEKAVETGVRRHWAGAAVFWGGACGLFSAAGYTAANICLRAVTSCDPIWVSCVKTFPTLALIGPWLIVLAHRGQPVLPPRQTLLALVLSAIFAHLGGNVLFQWALGVIGIALTVPITMGTIIVTGAIMGRMLLAEPVYPRAAVAIAILITAICTLSFGAGDAHRAMAQTAPAAGDPLALLTLAAGVGAAMCSGLAYSVLGVVIRYGVTRRCPLSTTMVTVSVVGLVVLGTMSYVRIGIDGMLGTTSFDGSIMLLAGVFNAVAFLALTKALQLTTVTYVNALGSAQVAMAAIAGVIIFHEALTVPMIIGVALTAMGLAMMDGRQKQS